MIYVQSSHNLSVTAFWGPQVCSQGYAQGDPLIRGIFSCNFFSVYVYVYNELQYVYWICEYDWVCEDNWIYCKLYCNSCNYYARLVWTFINVSLFKYCVRRFLSMKYITYNVNYLS